MAQRLRSTIASGPRDELQMSLVEHLDELRSRIIKVAIAFILVAIVAWFFRAQVFEWLLAPADVLGGELYFTSVTAPIITDVKITLYVGLMITLPWAIYQGWSFIAPAVGTGGRLFTYTLTALSSLLFLGGAAFGYYLVMPLAMDFLIGWGGDRFEQIITADTYLAFVTRFLLAFGVAFEVPAATYVGAKLGIINAPALRKYRRHALMVNLVAAALITPADPFSLVLLAVPLILLYEVSIFIARAVNPVDPEEELEEYDPEDEEDEEDTDGR
ncbi:MAG: twin-arginine translocase subunit TatC [Rubrobacter sp.]|jgi:sec-independent protein translocase protein TatC|nr:twin-arginine translocase subunit TatC [Rubrobacter sp.]